MDTHPEIRYWLPRYIKLRGTRSLASFPHMSRAMHLIADSQDSIPWKDFMEGKLSKEIFALQGFYMIGSPALLTIASWSKQLVSKILLLSHSQWIYRNVSLHNKNTGYLALQSRKKSLAQIEALAELPPAGVPKEYKYLLEMDFNSLLTSPQENHCYWIYAMQAAHRAGRRTAHQQHRRSQGSSRQRLMARLQAGRQRTQPSLGAIEVEREIERDHIEDTRDQPSRAARELLLRSNKRKKPD